MYKVVKGFADLQDKEYVYEVGDTYPRPNFVVSEDRVKELMSFSNKIGMPLIEKVEDDIPITEEPKAEPKKRKKAVKSKEK